MVCPDNAVVLGKVTGSFIAFVAHLTSKWICSIENGFRLPNSDFLQLAVNLHSSSKSLMWLRKDRGVADARKAGNEFYKAGKYLETCSMFGQGLQHDPTNWVLLCNRAACRSKLGQWEMAIDDCNAALRNRPDYSKALLRRAHSNVRLERWEESLRDYSILSKEMPGDHIRCSCSSPDGTEKGQRSSLECFSTADQHDLMSKNTMLLLYNIVDLLSLKGYTKFCLHIYKLIIILFKGKNIPLELAMPSALHP